MVLARGSGLGLGASAGGGPLGPLPRRGPGGGGGGAGAGARSGFAVLPLGGAGSAGATVRGLGTRVEEDFGCPPGVAVERGSLARSSATRLRTITSPSLRSARSRLRKALCIVCV